MAVHSKYVQPWMNRLGHTICALPGHICIRPLAQQRAVPHVAPTPVAPEAEPACAEAATDSQALSSSSATTQVMHQRATDSEDDDRTGVQERVVSASWEEMPAEADINSSTISSSMAEGRATPEDPSAEVTPACSDTASVDELAVGLASVGSPDKDDFTTQPQDLQDEMSAEADRAAWCTEEHLWSTCCTEPRCSDSTNGEHLWSTCCTEPR